MATLLWHVWKRTWHMACAHMGHTLPTDRAAAGRAQRGAEK